MAFANLKEVMTKTSVLHLPNFSKEFVVETDANSNLGIGVVLMQDGHPIACYNKKLGPRKQLASTYSKELHAVVEAIKKWRQYLLGRKFVVRTDHRSLKDLLQQVIHSPEQQVYIRKLLGFDFRIEYKTGKTNIAADSLSRICEEGFDPNGQGNSEGLTREMFMELVSFPTTEIHQQIRAKIEEFQDLRALRDKCQDGTAPPGFAMRNEFLTFNGRLVLSTNSRLKDQLLKEFHSTPLSGHMGIKRTLVRLAAQFFWVGMCKEVEKFISQCLICQQVKSSTQALAGLLQPFPIPQLV